MVLPPHERIMAVDFEYQALPGERPVPICMVTRECRSGEVRHYWYDELRQMKEAPFSTGADTLFVSFYAPAEIGCFLALGWKVPTRILDLFVEFSNLINGRPRPDGKRSLLAAMSSFGLDGIETVEKESMRALAMRGVPFSNEERQKLLDYCQTDVDALYQLLPRMLPHIDLPRALLRGRYMVAVARMERNGTPLDMPALGILRDRWAGIKDQLIRCIDANYQVFEGSRFVTARWERWLKEQGIAWPLLESGNLDLKDETFKQMAAIHPSVGPMRELRASLSKMKLHDLAVGADGYNRCMLSPFRSRTGRNQPSSTRFIFGPSTWLRSLIRPRRGWGLAYADYCQQEIGIAARLSGDPALIGAYDSGAPYVAFAVQAGAAPEGATKASHPEVRELYKQCSLAVLYGMGAPALALRIGKPLHVARELLEHHHRTYPVFWAWLDAAVDHAMLRDEIGTVFGWVLHVDHQTKPTTLRNFPMQSNASEMLRVAACLTTEAGIRACAPVHDALLVEAPLDELDYAIKRTQEAMDEASRIVLAGFPLRTDVEVVRYPDRYRDKRGQDMWNRVWELIGETP